MKELERVISESRLLGPVIMLGDFNAHLGGWECQQNMQGVLLQEMLERCELSAVSEGAMASWPGGMGAEDAVVSVCCGTRV